jgi:hypothetical protein
MRYDAVPLLFVAAGFMVPLGDTLEGELVSNRRKAWSYQAASTRKGPSDDGLSLAFRLVKGATNQRFQLDK